MLKYMKKTLFIITLLAGFSLLLGLGCQKAENANKAAEENKGNVNEEESENNAEITENFNTYMNEEYGFSIQYPNSWFVNESFSTNNKNPFFINFDSFDDGYEPPIGISPSSIYYTMNPDQKVLMIVAYPEEYISGLGLEDFIVKIRGENYGKDNSGRFDNFEVFKYISGDENNTEYFYLQSGEIIYEFSWVGGGDVSKEELETSIDGILSTFEVSQS